MIYNRRKSFRLVRHSFNYGRNCNNHKKKAKGKWWEIVRCINCVLIKLTFLHGFYVGIVQVLVVVLGYELSLFVIMMGLLCVYVCLIQAKFYMCFFIGFNNEWIKDGKTIIPHFIGVFVWETRHGRMNNQRQWWYRGKL